MIDRPNNIERAYELARGGECKSITEIQKKLRAEGYYLSNLEGRELRRALRQLCREAAGLPVSPPRRKKRSLTGAERSAAASRASRSRKIGAQSE